MSFPRYPKYNASSVECLGEVPEHWTIARLKHLASVPIKNGLGAASDMDDPAFPRYIRITDIAGPRSLETDTFRSLPPDLATEAPVQQGDILFACVGATFGKSYLHDKDIGPACYAGYLARFSPAPGVDPRFVSYWTQSKPYWAQLDANVIQSTVQNFSASKYQNLDIAAPPADEQRAIAAFLDRETTKIDALVAEQERLIELLAEKRQAVISHAVTKGLDPTAPMKPSGIEWLGDVPAHWEVMPLMRLTPDDRQIMYGIVLPGPDVEDGVPIVKGGDVAPGRLTRDRLKRTTFEIEASYARSRLKAGDIVYSIRGSIGDAELVPYEIEGANITQDAARVAPRPNVHGNWLLQALRSSGVFGQLDASASGATIRGINIFSLKRARIPVPPHGEQVAIARELERTVSTLGALVSEARRAVQFLQERRSALVSAAVTGQIDVRSAVSVEVA